VSSAPSPTAFARRSRPPQAPVVSLRSKHARPTSRNGMRTMLAACGLHLQGSSASVLACPARLRLRTCGLQRDGDECMADGLDCARGTSSLHWLRTVYSSTITLLMRHARCSSSSATHPLLSVTRIRSHLHQQHHEQRHSSIDQQQQQRRNADNQVCRRR
jgi:hypothetical protein